MWQQRHATWVPATSANTHHPVREVSCQRFHVSVWWAKTGETERNRTSPGAVTTSINCAMMMGQGSNGWMVLWIRNGVIIWESYIMNRSGQTQYCALPWYSNGIRIPWYFDIYHTVLCDYCIQWYVLLVLEFLRIWWHYHCNSVQKTMVLLTMVLCPNSMVMEMR